jgi:RNA polymerase sigma-70 factor (ECF subfamily)
LSSEDELIRLAQSGDTGAFCLLAEAYERRIYSLAFHYCRDREDAEDLSQEVWLKAYAALSSFRNESTFYTWLRRITINCFLNHRRSKSSRILSEPREESSAGPTLQLRGQAAVADFESALQNRLVVEKVMQALADVTPQQRLIFLLKHEEGMTYAEISLELGCSLGTVKKSVARTVEKLRERLRAEEELVDCLSSAATGALR